MAIYLSPKRFRNGGSDVYQAAVSDRGRVVFSAPFRRLQEKAQVFSLEDDAAVRTRLTHSLEVAHIGMHLMREILKKGQRKLEKIGVSSTEEREASVIFVETACLLHDIGNPPFGHFGEKVIRHWFSERKDEFIKSLGLEDNNQKFLRMFKDFELFDGNPQGFRIVSKLQWNHDENGLNLTATQLASLLKYIASPDSTVHEKKKFGYFEVDRKKIEAVWECLNMDKDRRHPLSYVMEAADDMAYCLSDIEDGIQKGIISMKDVKADQASSQFLNELLRGIYSEKEMPGKSIFEDLQKFLKVKTAVTNNLYERFSSAFLDNLEDISNGSSKPLIKIDDEANSTLKYFRRLAEGHLYDSRVVRENEIKANKILRGILDAFLPLLNCSRERFDAIRDGKSKDGLGNEISIEQALFLQLGKKFVKVYERDREDCSDAIDEWIIRAHMVVDHLSGMTDKYALAQFKLLKS